MKYLKRFFLFLGILLIIMLIIYAAAVILTGTSELFPKTLLN